VSLPDIKSLTRAELEASLQKWGEPAYRGGQVLNWLYRHQADAWEKMTNLPAHLRQRLAESHTLHALELVTQQGAPDSTQKFLWRLHDHALIESVLIPASPALYGEASDRHTLCISTQVGCAYGCRFCASGLAGWKRDLTADEIVEQVVATERWRQQAPREGAGQEEGRVVNNVVVMGMGEPLANYDHLLRALRILNAPWGGGIGARKITVSTSGLAPAIRRLAEEPLQLRLAVSLHAATDQVRSRLMPVNRKYPLAELIAACTHYLERKGRMITFEYILIAGVNDSPEQAAKLAELAHQLHAQVNLIPYNEVTGLPWARPNEAVQHGFLAVLHRRRIKATLRLEKGGEIDAACGQLRLKTEREMAAVGKV
jgi:23S rRNA (adenine2503-C2)-methyltransferase